MNRKQRSSSERINIGEDDHLLIEGYKRSKIGIFLLIVLTLLSAGILLLIIAWKPSIKTKIMSRKCSLDQAHFVILKVLIDYLFIENGYKITISSLQRMNLAQNMLKKLRYRPMASTFLEIVFTFITRKSNIFGNQKSINLLNSGMIFVNLCFTVEVLVILMNCRL